MQGRFTSADEFTGGPDELYYFVDDASDNPTFYADTSNPQSLNKYQYSYNNPLRYVGPDGHEPTPDPQPQDPCGCDIQKQANQIRDAIRKLDEATSKPLLPITDIIGTSTPPTIGPLALPNDPTVVPVAKIQPLPPQQNKQPLPPPAPIQSKSEVKTATRTRSGVTAGKTVSDKQAADRLKRGGDVRSSSRAKARQVAKKAAPDGKVVHHKPHAPGYRPHYHDKKHKNGHSFY